MFGHCAALWKVLGRPLEGLWKALGRPLKGPCKATGKPLAETNQITACMLSSKLLLSSHEIQDCTAALNAHNALGRPSLGPWVAIGRPLEGSRKALGRPHQSARRRQTIRGISAQLQVLHHIPTPSTPSSLHDTYMHRGAPSLERR